jgi:hypothetical protein
VSLIVGFALFGSVTFLPWFFQTVFRSSPTVSGLRLIPLMVGLLVTSIISGRLISRTGRYKVFPVVGTAVMTGERSSRAVCVPNFMACSAVSSPSSHKGWTSHGRAGGQLPSTARLAYENAYVHALRPVFLVAAGISGVGFVLSLRLRERPPRATASPSQGLDDALAAPRSPSSLAELDPALSVLVSGERRRSFNRRGCAPGRHRSRPRGNERSSRRTRVALADQTTQRLPEVQQLLERLSVELAGQRP